MKKPHIIIWYLKSWRVIIGIIFFLVAIFGSSEGRVFRSAWDNSLQYEEPMDTDKRIGAILLGLLLLLSGLRDRYIKLKQLSNEEEPISNNEAKEES